MRTTTARDPSPPADRQTANAFGLLTCTVDEIAMATVLACISSASCGRRTVEAARSHMSGVRILEAMYVRLHDPVKSGQQVHTFI